MSQPNPSPFNILQSAPPRAVVDEEYRKASVQVLADGSQAVDGVVRLQIFDREIWYDIENHIVQKWTGSEAAGVQSELPTAASSTCTGCSCGHGAEHDTSAATSPAAEEERYQKQAQTTRRLYDVNEEKEVNTIELHVNDKCNFRCNYCYLKSANIEYLDNEMPRDVAKKSIDFLFNNLPAGGTGVIKFYGGEPFLSYGLMKYVVQYARESAAAGKKRVAFTVTTNGTLLNPERIAWCKENNVRVTISLDGNEASNDKHRVYESGNGTYKVVARKAKQFLEEAGYLNLRATINDGSFELKDSMLEFAKFGSKQVKFQTDFNLVGETHVTHQDADKLMGELSELAQIWLERLKGGEKIPYGNMLEPMIKAYYTVKTPYRCGAARSLIAVSPKGKMYPCHRFIDVNDLEMGNVDNGLDGRQRKEFIDNRVELKEPCNKCWARYFCGGGCAFNNYFTNANIRDTNNVHCKLFRHQVKLGLYMFTELKNLTAQAKAAQSEEPAGVTAAE